jgi:putative pyruvate formate lyase activating enzyme
MLAVKPSYISLCQEGKIDEKIDTLYEILKECKLCPRKCGVNRLLNEHGYCRSGKDLIVSSIGPHFGEEDVLVGSGGSGTVFLTNCNLGCIFGRRGVHL